MLLAIDVGNTHTVFGVEDGTRWHAWRVHTDSARTEDEHGVLLRFFLERAGLWGSIQAIVIANVVPALDEMLRLLAQKWFGCEPLFTHADLDLGIRVCYHPPSAVGADRLANAVAAVQDYGVPSIVVDFGTAITLDAISKEYEYLGGAILPGIYLSLEALAGRTAKLPWIAPGQVPEAIGRSTAESLRSGVLLGSAGAVEALIARFKATLGEEAHVIATGGLGERLVPLCPSIQHLNPLLTLEGLKKIWERNRDRTRLAE